MDGFAGRVSATRVRLTVAVPFWTQLMVHFFAPLQDEKVIDASNRTGRNERVFLRFMWHPTTE
jgi:hypothetical protein